ncbi:putative AC9 transposase [Bienertia sinuspersici]
MSILDTLYELYAVVIQPVVVGSSSKSKSRFGLVIRNILKKPQIDSSLSSSPSSSCKNSSKFPVLARIAKDSVAIPASTITSESGFITGKRV